MTKIKCWICGRDAKALAKETRQKYHRIIATPSTSGGSWVCDVCLSLIEKISKDLS